MRRPAAVFTIALTLGAIILATAPGALATTTISNTPPWDGHSVFNGFGVFGSWRARSLLTATVPLLRSLLERRPAQQ